MKIVFARLRQILQPNVRMVAQVVPMIVFISSMLSCDTAESLKVPEHAYSTYGDSWKCERGFKRDEDECQSIQVPEHAFLAGSGDSWKCERGFNREGDRCSPK